MSFCCRLETLLALDNCFHRVHCGPVALGPFVYLTARDRFPVDSPSRRPQPDADLRPLPSAGTAGLANMLSDILQQLLQSRGLSSADGRPLYDYRASADELDIIRGALEAELPVALRCRRTPTWLAQGFCLWAAEWWRNYHEQGPWRWDGLLQALGCPELGPGGPGYPYLCALVAQGISGWKRRLLRMGSSREFLLTLACEGGLPLRLVHREHGRLGRYFRALLEEMRVYGASRAAPAELAERVCNYLPRSLRNEVVFRLSGDLVHAVWILQEKVRDSATPARDLDDVEPGWRSRLPLRLDDALAERLLNNLLLDAVRTARGGRRDVRWRRYLERADGGWRLVGEPSLPSALEPDGFAALFGAAGEGVDVGTPDRFDLSFRTDDGRTTLLTLATARVDRDGRHVIGLEHAPGARKAVGGADAALGRALLARHGGKEHATRDFAGASALEDDLPWVFVPESDADDARLVFAGQGGVTTRALRAWVAVPHGCLPVPRTEGGCEPAGELADPCRAVFLVSGAVLFMDGSGTRVVVHAGSPSAAEPGEYWLDGRRTELGRDGAPVFRGTPCLRIRRGAGPSWRVPPGEIQWFPEGAATLQRGDPSTFVGAGRLRHVVGGEVRFSSRIQILPAAAELRYFPDGPAGSGTIEFTGCGGPAVSAHAEGVRFELEQGDGGNVRLRCRASGEPPACLDVVLGWERRGQLRLTLPFPTPGGAFFLPSGQRVEAGAVVAAGRLAGIRAVALVPRAGATFYVEGTLRGVRASEAAPGWRCFRAEMEEVERGHFELDLGRLHGEVAKRLQDDADAEVVLRLQSNEAGDIPLRSLQVRRFDLRLENEPNAAMLRIPFSMLPALRPDEVDALQVRAVPLYQPDAGEMVLPRVSAIAWEVPDLPAGEGPWLIVGEHQDWLRIEPRIWLGEAERAVSISGEDGGANRVGGREWAVALAEDTDDPGWPRVDALIRWTERIPATFFRALEDIAAHPAAAAQAALRADERQLPLVWRTLESLGGWWPLVPRSAWEHAARVRWEGLCRCREALAVAMGEEAEDFLRREFDDSIRRVQGQLPWLQPVLGFLRGRLMRTKVPGEANAVMRDYFRMSFLERRKAAVDACPVLELVPGELREIPGFDALRARLSCVIPKADRLWIHRARYGGLERISFVNAPVAAALAALADVPLSAPQRRALRHCHDLRPDWFRELYDCAYLYALGAVEQEKQGMVTI